jgi:hypothetical protein
VGGSRSAIVWRRLAVGNRPRVRLKVGRGWRRRGSGRRRHGVGDAPSIVVNVHCVRREEGLAWELGPEALGGGREGACVCV